jgi:copper chaperone
MNSIKVTNIKCGGCEKSVISALKKADIKDISVNIESQQVSFEGDAEKAKKILSKMGYPEAGSPEAKSFAKKAKSYVSCAIGRMK